MPLLIRMVTIEPGTVWPLGDVPTTVPYRRSAVDRADVVGDLEAGVPQALAGGVLIQPGHAGHPRARALRRRSADRSAAA